MIEYGSKKVLFIHIPKTGGSSIEKWFGSVARLRLKSPAIPSFMKCTPQHLRYTDLEELFGDIDFDCIFSIVRNPYARVESEYRWRLSMNRNLPTFSEWTVSALQALKHDPWFLDNHYRPQIEFLGAPVRVFRFEDGLDAVFDFVSAEMGIPCPAIIPHEKRSGGIAADLPWTPELIAAVHDAYEGVEDDPHRFMTITKRFPAGYRRALRAFARPSRTLEYPLECAAIEGRALFKVAGITMRHGRHDGR